MAGVEYKPLDYLKAVNQFVTENPDHIDAVKLLLDRPRAWSPAALTELREKLARSRFLFSVENLQRAHESTHRKALVEVISMVKVTAGKTFSADQQKWLDRIREHVRENLSIDREDFEVVPIFADFGGWGVARTVFGEPKLDALLGELNEAIAA